MPSPQRAEPADLAADTAARVAAGGGYRFDLSDRWSFRHPSGGALMTCALRAMRAELDEPAFAPRSATAVFCSPVRAGELEVDVQVLRRGGSAAQLRAALRHVEDGGPGLEVSATFARERRGPSVEDAAFPEVAAPEACGMLGVDPRDPHARRPFFANFDMRLARGGCWWRDDFEPGPARFARWFRYLVPQRDAGGALDPLALPPVADTMPAALIQHFDPRTEPRYHAPSLDLTVHFLEPTRAEWLLVSAWARKARAGYATAEVEIWSDERVLIAYATQTMFLREARKR